MNKVIVYTQSELDISYYEEFKLRKKSDNTTMYGKCRVISGNIIQVTDDNQEIDVWKNSPTFCVADIMSGKYEIVKKLQEPFWAMQGDKFYFINTDDRCVFDDEFDKECDFDLMKRKLGNCFRTDRITKEQIDEYIKKVNNGVIV